MAALDDSPRPGKQPEIAVEARTWLVSPKVLLLDEPTEGMQPSIILELARTLKRICDERAEHRRLGTGAVSRSISPTGSWSWKAATSCMRTCAPTSIRKRSLAISLYERQTASQQSKGKTWLETPIKVDLSQSSYGNDMIHNRWHPDIPMGATVKPGQDFIIECYGWTGGFIKNDESAADVRDIELSIAHFLSGPGGSRVPNRAICWSSTFSISACSHNSRGFNGFFSKKNGGASWLSISRRCGSRSGTSAACSPVPGMSRAWTSPVWSRLTDDVAHIAGNDHSDEPAAALPQQVRVMW
jgi:Acetamidase/Formamidase family